LLVGFVEENQTNFVEKIFVLENFHFEKAKIAKLR
jgi:hypothetical protein